MSKPRPIHRKPLTEAQIAQRRAAGRAKKPGMRQTEAALAQRRAASESGRGTQTGAKTPEGKAITSRNAWKHGLYSAANHSSLALVGRSLTGHGRPCKTTCAVHPDNPNRTESPCSLVTGGLTRAGGDCLDRQVYVEAFDHLMAAMVDGDMGGLNGVLAANMAGNLQLLQQLRDEIALNGLTMVTPMVDREGTIVRDEHGKTLIGKVHTNPALHGYIRLLESIGLNLPEMMATPRAREKLKDDEERTDTMSALLGAVMNKFGGPNAAPRRAPIEHHDA